MANQTRWSRVLIESVVIVGSILLAFGIQAWWDWGQERALERDALERLEAEFVELDSVLVEWRGNHAGKAEAGAVLLGYTQPNGSTDLSTDSLARLINAVRYGLTIDPPLATLTAIQASGQLAAIRSQRILTQLAFFQALMDDLQGDEESQRQILNTLFTAYVYSNLALRTILSQTPTSGAVTQQSAFPNGFTAVLGTREFENLVVDIRQRSWRIVGNYDAIRESLATLSAMIRQELEGTN